LKDIQKAPSRELEARGKVFNYMEAQ
jgi:hypothetical protein